MSTDACWNVILNLLLGSVEMCSPSIRILALYIALINLAAGLTYFCLLTTLFLSMLTREITFCESSLCFSLPPPPSISF